MDRDELIAFAEENDLKVDRRLGDEKLREQIEAQLEDLGQVSRDWGDQITDDDIDRIADAAAAEVVAEFQSGDAVEPAEWPKRIAPCAWLDQDGNRWTDLGQAAEAVERITGRG